MTTITTVGYGDISGTCLVERVFCIFMHLVGVLSYSFLSGSLTAIIFSYDQIGSKNTQQFVVLQRLLFENNLPSDLFYQTKLAI